jgi:hypothetical protein
VDCLKSAMSSRKQVQQCWCRRAIYSITSSARATRSWGIIEKVFVWFMILAFYATLAAPHVHAVWVALQ